MLSIFVKKIADQSVALESVMCLSVEVSEVL